MKIVIGDTRDCAIGFFETKKKIGHVITLEENITRTCRVPLSYESVIISVNSPDFMSSTKTTVISVLLKTNIN